MKRLPVHLIYGPDAVEIQEKRLAVVAELLPAEHRAENLAEFAPSGNRKLTLDNTLPDLLAELGTVSFFPGVRRVCVLSDLADLWSGSSAAPAAAKAKKPAKSAATESSAGEKSKSAEKASPEARLIRFLESDFDPEQSALVITMLEDEEKRLAVNKKSALAEWIAEHGHVTEFKHQPQIWAFGDAILDRNLNAALGIFREMYGRGRTEQAASVFNTILRQVRFLLQAKIVGSLSNTMPREQIGKDFLPADAKSNLMQMHSFPQGKYTRAAGSFAVGELTQALTDLHEINRNLYPSSADPHVADVGLLIEKLLIRLCSGEA